MKLAPLFALALLGACRRATESPPPFALGEICAVRIRELESLLPPAPPAPAPEPELVERVQSLVGELAHVRGKIRGALLEDLRSVGEPAVPIAAAIATETGRDADERRSAIEVLGAIDVPASSDALVALVDIERIREPWIRAHAAHQLAQHSSDHVLLPLITRLKYETDGETVIWIAAALAQHGNYAGGVGLRTLAREAADEQVREEARSMHQALAEEAGFPGVDALDAAWFAADPDPRLAAVAPSPRLRLEAWRRIADLSKFDLRRVDDARFSLSRSATWVVDLLVAALHEVEPYVRVHAAQTLERMGPRARAACRELVLGLDEPRLATSAAAALGSIGCPDALEALAAHTREACDLELRTASVAALGQLGSRAALPFLRPLLAAGQPSDLRQSAAIASIALGDPRDAVPILVEGLTSPGGDPDAAESALEAWLARTADADPGSGANEVLVRWKASASDPARTSSAAGIARRRLARSEVLQEAMPTLLAR